MPGNPQIAERLREAREKRFRSGAEAARALGMGYSTYIAKENATRSIEPEEAALFAHKFGIDLEYLLTGRQPSSQHGRPQIVEGAPPLAVRGWTRTNTWQEQYLPEQGDEVLMISSVSGVGPGRQYALRVGDDSINRRIARDEYAICVETMEPPKSGDVVVVERRRGELFEATIKVARIGASGNLELWPDSTSMDYQRPIVIEAKDIGKSGEVVVVGKVVGVYRNI